MDADNTVSISHTRDGIVSIKRHCQFIIKWSAKAVNFIFPNCTETLSISKKVTHSKPASFPFRCQRYGIPFSV